VRGALTAAAVALGLAVAGLGVAAKTVTIRPTDETFFQDIAFSPDGKRMTLSGLGGGKYAIYSARINGTDIRAITDTTQSSCWTSWSPDGTRLAYTVSRGGKRDVHVCAPDGSGSQPVTRDPADDSDPAWSPDGGTIAFVSERSGARRIHLMRPDGSNVRMLGKGRGREHKPEWSPDGLRILFYETFKDTDRVVVMNADGTGRRVLGPGTWPAWSRHGGRIVFARGPRGQRPDVYLMDLDGSNLRRIAHEGFFARFTPDGNRVAFLRSTRIGWPTPSALFVVEVDGTNERRVPLR
jgi:Tol biopolymer transport system component